MSKMYIYLLAGILSFWGLSVPEAPAEFDLNNDLIVDCEDLMVLFFDYRMGGWQSG